MIDYRSPFSLPATRAEALACLEDFLPKAVAYTARRNFVEPGHGNVSRLSPATRTRLLLERELRSAVRERHGAGPVAKFEDEVGWRLYWKGWLELRPAVWERYRSELGALSQRGNERARAVAAGESGVAMMDHFARELVETGYLHNHARMWWASYWIHVERLPWQIGADFFLRHLLDGDAASNTLSWRWVAGLHTPGKTYLVRRSNLEKYVHPDLLGPCREGLSKLDDAVALALPVEVPPEPVFMSPGECLIDPLDLGRVGLWLHDEDLLPEDSPLAPLRPAAIAAVAPIGLWKAEHYSERKVAFLRRALRDGADRAADFFQCPAVVIDTDDLEEGITQWAVESGLETVVALRPFVGPLADRLPAIREALAERGITLVVVRRPEDVAVMNEAKAGFFRFREGLAVSC
ncbi:MAG: FAD-binding domain-containing protein [Verrucomicrobiales bacterium]